jgi:hypothetical protein
MTYDEAVRLLGREDSALVNGLDRVLGLGLLVVTGFRTVRYRTSTPRTNSSRNFTS